MKTFITTILFYLLTLSAHANQADTIEGVWINAKGNGYIELKIDEDVLSGTIVGSPLPEDRMRKDTNNPEPALRERLLEGVTILQNLQEAKDNLWKGGTIYDPNNGKTYDCKITQIDADTIEVRGYLGISLFGRTEIWKRR